MTDTTTLSLRHERFVLEYLKDGNATQAYVRAGYGARSAQACASKLLAQPHIQAAVAAGRQRPARQMLEIAIDGQIRIGLEDAGDTPRGGTIELTLRDHSKREHRVRLRLGKLLTALTKPARHGARCSGCARARHHGKQEQRWLERQLDEAREALAEAQATIDAMGLTRVDP